MQKIPEKSAGLKSEDALVTQLGHPSTAKRRSAAKKLRKSASGQHCEAIVEAIRNEIRDPRTWETHYQLIMAAAMNRCRSVVPLLWELSQEPYWATMRFLAIADALVRLDRQQDSDPTPVLRLLDMAISNHQPMLASGAMRAVAMLRLVFANETISEILARVRQCQDNSVLIWTAAACAGWKTEDVVRFLQECCEFSRSSLANERSVADELLKIAQLSLKGEYLTFDPF